MRIRQTRTFTRWLSRLKDVQATARIDVRIRRLSLGNAGDVKAVGSGVSELRISYGPGYRIYYTQKQNELILLLVGGDKSTQQKDIEKAKKLVAEL